MDRLEAVVAEHIGLLSRNALVPASHPVDLALAEHVRHVIVAILRGGHYDVTLGASQLQCHPVIL